MKRYKVYIDISDVYQDIRKLNIRNYADPFVIIFIEAHNPDDACHQILVNLCKEIIRKENSIKKRIFCRIIKKYIKFDRILQL